MKDGRADARRSAAGCHGRFRGLPERGPAGRRTRLSARAGRSRLRATAGSRGAARLLALALALPRRRRHVPAERHRRRGLRGGGPPHCRDRPAARPRRGLALFAPEPHSISIRATLVSPAAAGTDRLPRCSSRPAVPPAGSVPSGFGVSWVWTAAPACYALQVDGLRFSRAVVFRVGYFGTASSL